MAKTRRPKDDRDQIAKKIQNQYENLFSEKEAPPAYINVRQAEEMKARIAELEAELIQRQAVVVENAATNVPKMVSGLSTSNQAGTSNDSSRNKMEEDELETKLSQQESAFSHSRSASSPRETVIRSSPTKPVEESLTELGNPAVKNEGRKRIGQWAAWIFATFSLILLLFSFYMVYIVGKGQPDLSDKTLEPVAFLMIVASLISFFLIRRNRLVQGTWLLLSVVLIPPIPAVFVLKDIYTVMILYIAILASILIAWVLPKTSRQRAIIASGVSILAISGIQAWNPGFRLGSSTLPDFTIYIIILAALALSGFFIRQAIVGNIRTKLIVSFVLIAVLSAWSVVYFVDRSSRKTLTETIGNSLFLVSSGQASQIEQVLENEFDKLNTLALADSVQQRAEIATLVNSLSQDEIASLDQQWREADAADNNSDPLVSGVLHDRFSIQLLEYQEKNPENVELFLTDVQGVSIATTDRTSDYLQADEEWWQAAYKDGAYIGQPEFDASSKTLAINMAVAVRAPHDDRIVGVLRTTVNINSLADVLSAGQFGKTGQSIVYLPNGEQIKPIPATDGGYELTVEKAGFDLNAVTKPDKKFLTAPINNLPSLVSVTGIRAPNTNQDTALIDNLGWYLVSYQNQTEALKPVTAQTQNNLTLAVGVALLAAMAAVALAQVLAGPIIRLNAVAEEAAAGNLTVQAKVDTNDEIGTLATTFNKMISQLGGLVGTLEQRVLDRTHDLELASEVGRTITEKIANLDEMLTAAVEMIRARFELYYTQVYLMDSTGHSIILRAGTGEVGEKLLQREHRLIIGTGSLNGRAVMEKKPIIVVDTSQNANFMPNPLLPSTRSEMAVPLIAGGRVIGVLDMQSDQAGTLNETNLSAFEALAGQLAIAIQNAALFQQAEEARSEVETQAQRMTKQGWQDFLNAIERGHKLGFAFDQNNIIPLQTDELVAAPAEALSTPVTVTGTNVGAIQISNEPDRNWTENEVELIQSAATQLGQHIENLRLLAQAEKYRAEAEDAVRRLTREGWDAQTRSELTPGYVFDLNQVKPLSDNGNSAGALKQPLIVRDESIGELAVDTPAESTEAYEILAAVASQLSGHIENLRLSEQIEKRASELQTVATLSSTTSTLLDPDKLLQTVVDLTKERFGLYHTHVYLADESWKTLLLAAGAGEVGRQMVAEGWNIPMDHALSIVANAARQRQFVIANNISRDKHTGFLSNYLLPDTRSEMAVPMIVGEKLLGVFDVQADTANHFTEEDANIYTTLASQVAVALQNARLYVEQAATVTQLRELDRLKSSFLANMSHELRTPLNSILGFSDVMLAELDGPLTDNMDNDLKLIQKNGQHLLHLINDVLDMAKIEAGRMNLVIEKFNLHEVLDEVTSITSALANEKVLELYIDPESDREVEIAADRTRFRQVMINLINNAMKFTDKGSVSIHTHRENSHVLIDVKDTGIGIPPEQLETVFQEFAQVDTSTTRKAGGTGLGLPISRRLIEMHGGRLWAESTGVEGEGSTFHVYLPVEAQVKEPDLDTVK